MTPEERVAEAVARVDLGEPTAAKRGRSARWPNVPIIRYSTGGPGNDGYTKQIKGRAFTTRDEAVEYAQRCIDAARESFIRQLSEPRHRALREHHGLP